MCIVWQCCSTFNQETHVQCSDKSCSLEVHHDYLVQCNLFVVVVVDFVLNVN